MSNWCPNATYLSSNEKFDAGRCPKAQPRIYETGEILEKFIDRHSRCSFFTFEIRHVSDGKVVFRGSGEEKFKISATADGKITDGVYYAELHLPITHPLFARKEPVNYFVLTESTFPLEEMKPYMKLNFLRCERRKQQREPIYALF
jgi:hypothetical protein